MVPDEVEVDVRERLAVVEARSGPRGGHLVVLHRQPVGRHRALERWISTDNNFSSRMSHLFALPLALKVGTAHSN